MFVDAAVDDGGDTAYDLAVTVGEVELTRAVLQRRVLVGEELVFVAVQRGDIGGDVFEELVGESNELPEVAARDDVFYDDFGHRTY